MYYTHPGCRTSIFGKNRAYCIRDFTVCNTKTNTEESMAPVRQNPIQRTVRTVHVSIFCKCAYDCAQLHYTIQHRTVLIISSLPPTAVPNLRSWCRARVTWSHICGLCSTGSNKTKPWINCHKNKCQSGCKRRIMKHKHRPGAEWSCGDDLELPWACRSSTEVAQQLQAERRPHRHRRRPVCRT